MAAKQVSVAQPIWFMTAEFLKLQDRGREFWSNFKEALIFQKKIKFLVVETLDQDAGFGATGG